MKTLSLAILFFVGIILGIPFLALFTEATSLEVWKTIMTSSSIYSSIFTTVLVAFLSLLLNIIIGTPAAEMLARNDFWGRNIVIGLIMLPFIIPGFVVSMGLHHSFIKFNLVENIIGVTLIHSIYTLPYYIRAVIVGYQTFSEEYEQMGWVFGANAFQRFQKITLPHIMPAIFVGSGLVLTVSFTQYLNTFIIGGGKVITIPILMFPYLSSGNLRVGTVYGVIFIMINLLLIICSEYLVRKMINQEGNHDKT